MQTDIEQAVCYQVTFVCAYSVTHCGFGLPQARKDKTELQHFNLCYLPAPPPPFFFMNP